MEQGTTVALYEYVKLAYNVEVTVNLVNGNFVVQGIEFQTIEEVKAYLEGKKKCQN